MNGKVVQETVERGEGKGQKLYYFLEVAMYGTGEGGEGPGLGRCLLARSVNLFADLTQCNHQGD